MSQKFHSNNVQQSSLAGASSAPPAGARDTTRDSLGHRRCIMMEAEGTRLKKTYRKVMAEEDMRIRSPVHRKAEGTEPSRAVRRGRCGDQPAGNRTDIDEDQRMAEEGKAR